MNEQECSQNKSSFSINKGYCMIVLRAMHCVNALGYTMPVLNRGKEGSGSRRQESNRAIEEVIW